MAVNLIVTQIHSVVDPTIRHRTIKFGRLSLINDNGDEFKNSPKRKLLSSSASSSSTSSSSSSSSTLSSSMVEKQNSLINGSNIVNEEKGEKPINGILNKTTKSIPVQIRYPNNGGGVYTNGHHHHHHHQACGLLADKIDDLYLSSSAPSYLNNGTIKFTTTNHKPLLMVNHDDNELKNDLAFHHHHQNHLRPSNQSSSSTISVSSTTTVTGVENTNNGQSAKILMIASR